MTTERVAIVIGGASGIGWASAQALAADGCRIVVADRDADGAAARATQLGAPHTNHYADVTNESSVEKLFEAAGPVDIVLNCAGFSNVGLITDLAVEDFRSVVDVCLNGGVIVAKHAGRNLPEGGVVGSVSSG
nr:SDR family NAD(P)-dependent oxidoreductase [Mycolicibacterium peregrinum]